MFISSFSYVLFQKRHPLILLRCTEMLIKVKQKRVDSKMLTDEWTAFASRLNGRYNKVTANGRSILREWKKTILIVSSIRYLRRSVYLSRGNNTKNVVYCRGGDFFYKDKHGAVKRVNEGRRKFDLSAVNRLDDIYSLKRGTIDDKNNDNDNLSNRIESILLRSSLIQFVS